MAHTTAATTVREFLAAYLSGDLDTARSMVRDDFSFAAPLLDVPGSKETFFAGSHDKVGLVRSFRVVRQWEDGDTVSTVYEIDVVTPAGEASMPMHETHTVRDGRLAPTMMSFDTGAPAARLLHEAIASSRD
jgi:ketosteroid isomerase-like protein